jgi:hypothetical protein
VTDRFRLMITKSTDQLSYFEVRPGGPDPGQGWVVDRIGTFDGIARPLIAPGPMDRTFFGMQMNTSVWEEMGFFHWTGKGWFIKRIVGIHYFDQTVAFLDADQLIHIYGIDQAGVISVLHQTGWKGPDADSGCPLPTWTQGVRTDTKQVTDFAVPFDTNAERMYLDAFPDSSPTLLIRYKNGDLMLRTQDLVTGRWWSESLRLATGRLPVAIPKLPHAGNARRCDWRSGIEAQDQGLGQDANPDQGRRRLSLPHAGHALARDRDRRLRSGEPLHTGGRPDDAESRRQRPGAPQRRRESLPLRPALTGKVLKDANVVPSWDGKPSPDQVVDSIGQIFSAAGKGPPPASAGFVIQSIDPTRPAYTLLTSRQELDAELALFRDDSYGGLVDDLWVFIDDLWVGIKSSAAKIGKVLFDAANGAVSFFVKLANGVVQLYKFVIQSLRDAADAVMAVFNCVGAAIDKVVDWLQSLLDLKDVWDTKTALEDGLRRLPDFILSQLLVEIGPPRIRAFLNEQRAHVRTSLEAFSRQFAGQRMHDLPGWQQTAATQAFSPHTVLLRSPRGAVVTRGDVDGPEANWFFDALKPFGASLPLGPMVPGLQPLLTQLSDAIHLSDLSFLLEFKNRFVALFDPANPDTLGSVVIDGLVDLLLWVMDRVFDVLIALAEIVFNLVDGTLRAVAQLLEVPILFPPIVDLASWVYRQAHKNDPNAPPPPPLTIAGLVSLMVAFPATLGWKIFAGDVRSPLFPGGRLPQPGRVPTPEEVAAGTTDGQRCLGVGGVIQINYMFLDITNDIEATHDSSLGAIVLELLMPMLIWPTPDGVPFSKASSETPTQQAARWANWAPGVCYFAADAFFFLVGWKGNKALARDVEPLGKIVLYLLGKFNLVMGVWESIELAGIITPAGIAANVLSPLSPMMQILRMVDRTNPAYRYFLGAKVITNVVSDAGGGLARVLAASGH